MNKLIVTALVEKKLARGIQLLEERDFTALSIANQLVSLFSQTSTFLGTAYLSKQNKGIGWFLSPKKLQLEHRYLVELFRKAKAKRQDLAVDVNTTAYRLFNQDGDHFGGLTIDRYGDFALFSWYNAFVYQHRDRFIRAFQEVYPDIKGAYEKNRFQERSYESAHLYGEEAPATFTILENALRYEVFLNDGLMTGIFLDQRHVRGQLLDDLAAGKRVLNLFSYTAAFSLAAAMGGASQTHSVDLAKRSIELSRAHFEQNHLDLESHHFVVMDVFDYFKYAKRHQLQFDIIVIDPPSFARNKKQTFSVQKDYHKLISNALAILAPHGHIIASTNAANMSVAQLKKELDKGFAKRKHHYSHLHQLPSDFAVNEYDERSNYLKVFTIKVD